MDKHLSSGITNKGNVGFQSMQKHISRNQMVLEPEVLLSVGFQYQQLLSFTAFRKHKLSSESFISTQRLQL